MLLALPFLEEPVYIDQKIVLFPCTCYDVHLFQGRNLVGLHLRVASCYRYHRFRALFFHPSNILAGLSVGQICNGACIYDIYIGCIFFSHDGAACRLKLLLHGLGLVLVDLAAQGVEGDSHFSVFYHINVLLTLCL